MKIDLKCARILALCAVSILTAHCAAQPASVPYTWRPVKIVAGGYVPGLHFHPAQQGLIYARTDMGGTYRYDASEHRWIPLNDWTGIEDYNNFGIESVAIDPNDPGKLYEAVGMYVKPWSPNGFILRSSDQGRTFQKTALPIKLGGNEEGRLSGERLAVDPNNSQVLYFGSRLDGLWESADGAVTWKRSNSFPQFDNTGLGIITIMFSSSDGTVVRREGESARSKNIYAAVSAKDSGLFHSSDGGRSWQTVAGQPTGLLVTNAVLGSDGMLFATYADHTGMNGMMNGAVWRLNTLTGKWSEITPIKPNTGSEQGQKFGYAGLAISASHPENVLVSTQNRWWPSDAIFRSTDSGKHWTEIADAHEPRNMSLSPWLRKPADVALGTGPWPTALAIDPFDGRHVLFGTGETIWETNDADGLDQGRFVHWKVGADGIEETADLSLVSPPIGPHLFSGVGDIGGFRHDEFDVSPPVAMSNPRFSNTTSIAYATQTPSLMARVGKTWDGSVYGAYSLDQGISWTPFASQPKNTTGGGTVAISADGKAVLWSSDAAAPSYSKDMGRSWTPADVSAAPKSELQAAADPVDPLRFYLLDPETGALLVSTDSAARFTAYAGCAPWAGQWKHAQLYVTPGREGDLWVGTENGLFHSEGVDKPFVRISSVGRTYVMGFGQSAPKSRYMALYLAGQVGGLAAIYRSDDNGESWLRIDDDAHRFGWISVITGDPRIYGRVYLGTNGRGVLYGDPVQ